MSEENITGEPVSAENVTGEPIKTQDQQMRESLSYSVLRADLAASCALNETLLMDIKPEIYNPNKLPTLPTKDSFVNWQLKGGFLSMAYVQELLDLGTEEDIVLEVLKARATYLQASAARTDAYYIASQIAKLDSLLELMGLKMGGDSRVPTAETIVNELARRLSPTDKK